MDEAPAARGIVCTHCGNNLAGVSYRSACPNCGKPVTSIVDELAGDIGPPANSSVARPQAGDVVSTDLPCLACAYNLRGLDSRSTCPECGTPVANSTGRSLLFYAGPDIIAQLHQGMKCVEWGLAIRFIAVAAIVALGSLGMASPLRIGIAIIAALVVFVLSTYGWWQVTSPHVVLRGLDRPRTWTRAFLIAGNLLELSFVASTTGQAPSAAILLTSIFRVSPCLWAPIFLGIWLTSVILSLAYAIGIARRIPNPGMASLSTVATWLVPSLVFVSLPLFILAPIAWLAAYIFYIVVIDRWRAELSRLLRHVQAAQDQQTPLAYGDPVTPPPAQATPPESPA